EQRAQPQADPPGSPWGRAMEPLPRGADLVRPPHVRLVRGRASRLGDRRGLPGTGAPGGRGAGQARCARGAGRATGPARGRRVQAARGAPPRALAARGGRGRGSRIRLPGAGPSMPRLSRCSRRRRRRLRLSRVPAGLPAGRRHLGLPPLGRALAAGCLHAIPTRRYHRSMPVREVRAAMTETRGGWRGRLLDADLEVHASSRAACLWRLRRAAGPDAVLTVEVWPALVGVAEAAALLGWDRRRVITY